MKKILLYIILFLSGIDGAWALPIEKEGMSIYSPSLKQEVSYSIILNIQKQNIQSYTCFME